VTATQLNQPRYQVISNYPDSPFVLNEYLLPTGTASLLYEGSISKRLVVKSTLNNPAIFRPLPWHEKRLVSEMPKFIGYVSLTLKAKKSKHPNVILKVKKWRLTLKGWKFYFPADEADYKAYCERKKKKDAKQETAA
jgi:hypothetical protein